MVKYVSKSERETRRLARFLAEEVIKTRPSASSFVVALVGDLGCGKTTFVKGFAAAVGVRKRVVSPTFLIIRKLPLTKSKYEVIYHIDPYRVSVKDLYALGVKQIINDPHAIVLVEWADKVKSIVPKGALWVQFKHGGQAYERYITFNRR